MIPEALAHAWNYLMAEGSGFTAPHGLIPGSYRGGVRHFATEEEWDAYGYNPPPDLPEYPYYDHDAGPKPSWAALVRASALGMLFAVQATVASALRSEVRRRINRVFDARDDEAEIWERLSRGSTPEALAERARLLGRYRILRDERILELTLDELRAFDPTDDAHWAAPPEP